jgi:hypothetical protein
MHRIVLLFFIGFLISTGILAQTVKITGRVTDVETEAGVSYATVFVRGTNTFVSTDFDGYYMLEIKGSADYVGVRCIGYLQQLRPVKKSVREEVMNFEMDRVDTNVNVREKYVLKKSEAAALNLIQKVITHKERNSKKSVSSYGYEAYTKLQGNLIELTDRFKQRKIFQPLKFVFNNMDTTSEVKPFLPFFIAETVSDFYHQKKRFGTREIIKASKISGVDDISITQFLGSSTLKADIYSDYLVLLTRQFVSPVSSLGPDCYIYYLEDSQIVDHYKCYKVRFIPRSLKLSLLEGEIWITDSSFTIKRIQLKMENTSKINPIHSVFLYNEFVHISGNVWMLKKEILGVNTVKTKKSPSFALRRTTVYSHFVINEKEHTLDSIFRQSRPEVEISDSAKSKGEGYWQRIRRNAGVQTHEDQVYNMIDTLARLKITHTYINIVQLLLVGYVDAGPVSIGSIYSFISHNSIDGWRLKYGMRTNARFSRQIRLGGYAAFGIGNKKFHYGAEVLWLIKKNPRLSMSATFRSDMTPTRSYNSFYATPDLLTTYGLRRFEDYKFIRLKLIDMREFKLAFTHEFKFGYSYSVGFLNQRLAPIDIFNFTYRTAPDNSASNTNITSATISEISLTQRLAWHERFFNSNFFHLGLGSKYPIVTFQFAVGIRGFLGSQFNYQRIGTTINDTRLLGLLGHIRYNIEAGRIFGNLPFLFLQIPEASETYLSAWSQFNTITKYSFAADRYVKVVAEHHLDGLIFDRIPGLKKLKFREVWGAHMWWGDMTAQNRFDNLPNLAENPTNTGQVRVKVADRVPFIEMNAGIENILSFFRIDAVWRVNYLDPRGTRFSFRYGNCGVRLSFKFQF